jgi:hypothetical protein
MAARKKTAEPATAPAERASSDQPSDIAYSSAVASAICTRIARGESLRRICATDGMPSIATVLDWLVEHPDFADRHAHAKEAQAEALAEDLLDIADDKTIDAPDKRIRVETRKWIAAKLKPRKYGDRAAVEITTSLETLTDEQLRQRLRDLLFEDDDKHQ